MAEYDKVDEISASHSKDLLTPALYQRLRNEIFTEFPEDFEELKTRCRLTRATVGAASIGVDIAAARDSAAALSADDVWRCMGDKPLFSAMRVTSARSAEEAWALGLYPDWREFASSGWDILDTGVGNAKKDDRFEVVGPLAKRFCEQRGKMVTLVNGREFKMPKTAVSRLYAMQQFARWLAKQSGEAPAYADENDVLGWVAKELAPGQPMATVRAAVERLASEFGLGWGVTTVLHGLMDLGFWIVKPDIHVVRTCGLLGSLSNSNEVISDPDRHSREIDTLFEVVGVARTLVRHIPPLPESLGKAIREVDVVLMRASYRKIVDRYAPNEQVGNREDQAPSEVVY